MRRARKKNRLAPFTAGITGGYVTALAAAAVGAVLILLTDSQSLAGAAAMAALAAGSFASGRISGAMRRHSGLATGAICGVLYLLPLILLSLVFGVMRGALLFVKLAVCTAFGAAGGVA